MVLEVGGDAGGPEGMVADAGLDAGGFGPPLNHAVGVLLPQGFGGEQAGAAGGRPEKRPVEVLGNASGGGRWCMNRLDPSGELRAGFGEA